MVGGSICCGIFDRWMDIWISSDRYKDGSKDGSALMIDAYLLYTHVNAHTNTKKQHDTRVCKYECEITNVKRWVGRKKGGGELMRDSERQQRSRGA